MIIAWLVATTAGTLALTAAAAVLTAGLDPVCPARGAALLTRPAGDLARLMRRRTRTTPAPDRLLWWVGAAGPLAIALLMAAVVPLAGHRPAVASPVGVVWFNALDVALWAALWLAGWGPNSVFPLLGGYRFLAQALAYELPLMFALTAPAAAAGSLDLVRIVDAQHGLWFVVTMPVAFLVFCAAVLGFAFWGPFGYPVGADAAGGVLAEQSGVHRLLLHTGQLALLAMGAAAATALFLGGGAGPLLPTWLWSLVKTLAVLAGLVAVRGRTPVLRADRLVPLAFLGVLPLMLVQLLVVSVIVVVRG